MTLGLEHEANRFRRNGLSSEAQRIDELINEFRERGIPDRFYIGVSIRPPCEEVMVLEGVRKGNSPYINLDDIQNARLFHDNGKAPSRLTINHLNNALQDLGVNGKDSLYNLGLSSGTLTTLKSKGIYTITQLFDKLKDCKIGPRVDAIATDDVSSTFCSGIGPTKSTEIVGAIIIFRERLQKFQET